MSIIKDIDYVESSIADEEKILCKARILHFTALHSEGQSHNNKTAD